MQHIMKPSYLAENLSAIVSLRFGALRRNRKEGYS